MWELFTHTVRAALHTGEELFFNPQTNITENDVNLFVSISTSETGKYVIQDDRKKLNID